MSKAAKTNAAAANKALPTAFLILTLLALAILSSLSAARGKIGRIVVGSVLVLVNVAALMRVLTTMMTPNSNQLPLQP
jgi:hypothetical protein